MAKITRISAGKGSKKSEDASNPPKDQKSAKLSTKIPTKISKISEQVEASQKSLTQSKNQLKQDQKQQKKAAKLAKKTARKAKRAAKFAKISQNKFIKVVIIPFKIIFTPFTKLGRYVKASWQELRQVQWPSRKNTWKMVGIVLLYTAVFMAFITILDAVISLGFNQILRK